MAFDIQFSLGRIAPFETMIIDPRTPLASRPAPLKLTHVLPPISTSRFSHLCRSRPRGSIRSLPTLTHGLPPIFDLSVLPIYVARVPAAPFARCFPRSFTFYVAHPI
jgi:hypothetical protein